MDDDTLKWLQEDSSYRTLLDPWHESEDPADSVTFYSPQVGDYLLEKWILIYGD